MKKIIPIVIFIMLFSISSFAHSGRTDSNGGHYDRSTGEYHYHNDGYNELEIKENSLTVTDMNDYQTKELKRQVDLLETQIKYKMSTISNQYDKLQEKNKEIQSLKNRQWYMVIGFVFILVITIYISYNMGLDKNK